MPDFFVIAINADGGSSFVEQKLEQEQTVIGRKSFFTCNDQRISRSHGLLIRNADEATITLRATHINPIFFKTNESDRVQLLHKEGEVTLSNDDQFGLLKDEFWYRLSIRNGVQLRVRSLNELNDIPTVPTRRIAPQIATTQDVDSTEPSPKRFCPGGSREEAGEATPEPTQAAREATPEPTQAAREATPEPSGEVTPIRAVPEPSDATPEPIAQTPGEATPAPQPETDAPTSSSPIVPAVPGPSSNPVEIKKEIKTEVKTEEADSSVYRDSCQFGVRCFRRNLEHRREVAHPNDTDYRRPNFPPAPPDAQPCPYGASCYRRNPQHFIEYSHPDSTQMVRPSPPLLPVLLPPSALPLPRARVRPPRRYVYDDEDDEFDDDDDDDEMDDFIASDDDDEEFVADANGSDTDDDLDDAELDNDEDDDQLDDGEVNEE